MAGVVGNAAKLELLKQMQLDESLYSLAPDELQFFQSTTGITSDAELKQHIVGIQTEAYQVRRL